MPSLSCTSACPGAPAHHGRRGRRGVRRRVPCAGRNLGVRDLIFTGRVNVVEYMEKLDFTILTSISEGQPLSVLESLAARRPCVTTEVGCCRELLEGAPATTLAWRVL
ncbi:MAG: glycosyltransferase [Collinsella sp.]